MTIAMLLKHTVDAAEMQIPEPKDNRVITRRGLFTVALKNIISL